MADEDFPFVPLVVFPVIAGGSLIGPFIIREEFDARRKELAGTVQIAVFKAIFALVIGDVVQTCVGGCQFVGVPVVFDIRLDEEVVSQTHFRIGYQITETSFAGCRIQAISGVHITVQEVDNPFSPAFGLQEVSSTEADFVLFVERINGIKLGNVSRFQIRLGPPAVVGVRLNNMTQAITVESALIRKRFVRFEGSQRTKLEDLAILCRVHRVRAGVAVKGSSVAGARNDIEEVLEA